MEDEDFKATDETSWIPILVSTSSNFFEDPLFFRENDLVSTFINALWNLVSVIKVQLERTIVQVGTTKPSKLVHQLVFTHELRSHRIDIEEDYLGSDYGKASTEFPQMLKI